MNYVKFCLHAIFFFNFTEINLLPQRSMRMTKRKILFQIFFTLASFFPWVSASSQETIDSQYDLQNTKLSIDPFGQKILVVRGLKTKNPSATITQRENGKFIPTQLTLVNPNLRHLGFSSSSQSLLEISRTKNITTLTRFNFETGQRQLIYRESKEIWIPREIGIDDYVYFQATAQVPSQGIWVRQQRGTQKILFSAPDRLSSKANLTDGSLYVMSWTTPRSFFALTGKVPTEAENFAKEPNVWEINCANSEPLQCVRDKLKLTKFGYLASIEMTKGLQVCTMPGQWFDLRELQISENGNYAIFHAKTPGTNGLRSIYLASYAENECVLDIVFSEKDGKWELQ